MKTHGALMYPMVEGGMEKRWARKKAGKNLKPVMGPGTEEPSGGGRWEAKEYDVLKPQLAGLA